MSKTLQDIMGWVVVVLVVVSIVLVVLVLGLNRRVKEVGAEADSLYAWVYRSDPQWSPRWELIRSNFNVLRGNRRIDTLAPLPPWGAVPPIPPRCVPPEPCPPQ